MVQGVVSADAVKLIEQSRLMCGVVPALTQGAVALATWIVENRDRDKQISNSLMGDARLLCGMDVPDDEVSEVIGVLTGGAVTRAMFDQPFMGEWPGLNPETMHVCEIGTPDATGVLVEIDGPIGTIPGGPLWSAVHGFDRQFALVGPGIGIVLDETQAWAMREALTVGLMALRGNAASTAMA